ncbi:MAG: UDP-N-acetylmuramoyl-L-alanyl-D-glutamate--2,6-diaminopimelate ligase [Sporomusaceae bacterium]|jgi:UDP-N-acetylmuramyl-tripeptide synthetase|nr:UDP-N-acetylmuramoyl-L-alanyl-D-glutamate--2,6-diaminopimelate ligase [Sporomusaceae bacterium]
MPTQHDLEQILQLLPVKEIQGATNLSITSLTHDSRKVAPGALFAALTGQTVDAHAYLAEAQKKGAAAALIEKEVAGDFSGMTLIKTPDTNEALKIIAPYFYGYPSQKMRLIGITGTNGKTTTAYLIRDILRAAGYQVGLIGTIEILLGDESLPTKNTTPLVADLQEILATMVSRGMDHVVMEVSSHALKLGRTAGCEFDVGVFTNITQDHLDFHLDFEDYLLSKGRLFTGLGAGKESKGPLKAKKAAVINLDAAHASVMVNSAKCPQINYAIKNPAELTARNISLSAGGASLEIVSPALGKMPVNLRLTGLFNIYNVLAAVGAALAENIDPKIICRAAENFKSVRGRFELIDAGQPFSVIIDYAHTPDGMENVLKTAREFVPGRIICVFGCGGDRDKTKRPIMGRLAVQYAEIIIATSDNPRREDPLAILKDIEKGIEEGLALFKGEKRYKMIADRAEAIKQAITWAQAGDAVLILGKGHETYQILKERTIHFDDGEIAGKFIKELL